jgi:hypothetical protein
VASTHKPHGKPPVGFHSYCWVLSELSENGALIARCSQWVCVKWLYPVLNSDMGPQHTGAIHFWVRQSVLQRYSSPVPDQERNKRMFRSEWRISFGVLACRKNNLMTPRVSMLLKSRASPDMLPSSLSNKKILAIRHTNRPHFPTALSIPSNDFGK